MTLAGAGHPERGQQGRRRRATGSGAREGLACAVLALLAAACGSSGSSGSNAPSAPALDPSAPRWTGGCFLTAPAGKVIDAVPAADVLLFGGPCSEAAGATGIVYLDRFDPVSGDGDVTVLSTVAGATPVVVAPHGGGGAIEVGSLAARIDTTGTRLLALANVGYVTGDLIEAPLPSGRPVRTIAQRVRMENYDFTADGGVLYVANYDSGKRVGDLFHAGADAPRLIAQAASRFDFVMYRLAPDGARVAFLQGWNEDAGGDLLVQPLPPASAATVLAHGVVRMAWSSDGHLLFRTVNADHITYALWSWDGTAEPRQLAPEVHSATVVGDDVLYATDWAVLEQRALLHLTPVAGGSDFLAGAGPAALQVTTARPSGSDGVIAWFDVPAVTVPTDGTLRVTRFSRLAPQTIDAGVTIGAGVGASPAANWVSYALGFSNPQTPGSANPQPGIANTLKVAAVDGGAPFMLANTASTFVAWDPLERSVAALGDFEPAVNRGTLVVRSLPNGTQLLSLADVGNGQFGFAADGSLFWAIRGWDDAQRRGELVLVPVAGPRAWQPTAVATNVTAVGPAENGRAMYAVRGGGRDGWWVGAIQ